eukprot:scaffold100735_cov75-Phaeocystis_antarctica.AAC.1
MYSEPTSRRGVAPSEPRSMCSAAASSAEASGAASRLRRHSSGECTWSATATPRSASPCRRASSAARVRIRLGPGLGWGEAHHASESRPMKCTTSHRRPPPRSLGCASQACTTCARAAASDTCGAGGGTASGTSDTLGRLSARGGPRAPTLSTYTRWPRLPVSLASSTSATCASSHGSTPPHSPCAAAEAMSCSRAAPTMQTRSARGEPPCGVSGALSSSSTELTRCVPGSAKASTRSENI